jgi:hypothetical protein
MMGIRVGGLGCAAALWLCAAVAAHAASIDVGSASGMRGDRVSVAVSLRAMDAAILGTQNRISFDRDTPIAAGMDGQPDCAVNPAIDKNATGFRFLPLGCDPAVDCTAVRAFVLAFDNLAPIPDGAVLYSCGVAIAADATPGEHGLHNDETGASALGGDVVPTTGTDGAVTVTVVTAPVASIDIGSVTGMPGETVSVPVTLRALAAPPANPAAVQNDIGFDPQTPIAATADAAPQCRVDAALERPATFSFLPAGCVPGVDCTGVHAAVAANGGAEALPDGATLYTCDVAIATDATIGAHPLAGANPSAVDTGGAPVPVSTTDGVVSVVPAPPPACVGDCNGDRVVSINELLIGVNIANNRAPTSACAVLDVDQDGTVRVNELIHAVRNALTGCPAR